MLKASDLKVKVERVGKYFHLKDGNGNVVATIDMQKSHGLSDEETAQLVARLDAQKESDTPEKQRGGYELFNPPAYWGPAYEKAKESE